MFTGCLCWWVVLVLLIYFDVGCILYCFLDGVAGHMLSWAYLRLQRLLLCTFCLLAWCCLHGYYMLLWRYCGSMWVCVLSCCLTSFVIVLFYYELKKRLCFNILFVAAGCCLTWCCFICCLVGWCCLLLFWGSWLPIRSLICWLLVGRCCFVVLFWSIAVAALML